MSYNQPPYGRPGPQPPQGPGHQGSRFVRPPYPPGNPYFYPPQNQQFMAMPPAMPQYQMMQFPPQQHPQQGQVYIPEEQYQMAQPMRYQQPQPMNYQAPSPYADTRKRKKDYQIASTTALPPKKMPPQPQFQSNPIVQPMPVQPPQPKIAPPSQTTSTLESFIPKINQSRSISINESTPPGCFNLIKRGNIPGITFSHVCTV